MASKTQEAAVHNLLSRSHSPTSTKRIYTEKIQYRPLLLRPSSPTPSDSRSTRRSTRLRARALSKTKPAPLSGRAARRLGLYTLPRTNIQYPSFLPLKKLWEEYARDLLTGELFGGSDGVMASAAAKLAGAEFHGAEVEVCRSRCAGRVGLRGIVVKDAQQTFEIVTEKNQVKVVPKEGTTFRVRIPVEGEKMGGDGKKQDGDEENVFVFEILGDQFMYRAADRANRKFRNHFLKTL